MDHGFGFSTLILVGLGCGALGYLGGVEEPLLEPDATPSIPRRSAKKVRRWVSDLKAKRTAKKVAKMAESVAEVDTEDEEGDNLESLMAAVRDPEVMAELTPSERARADLIGDIMGQLHAESKKRETTG